MFAYFYFFDQNMGLYEMNALESQRQTMIELLENQLPEEAVKTCSLKGVKLFRMDKGFNRAPKSYEAQIVIMAQGQKRVYLGDETFVYDPFNYLVLSVPLPIECEAVIKDNEPILAIVISIDHLTVGELLLEMNDESISKSTEVPKGIYGAAITDEIANAAMRLLQALASEKDERILGP